LSGSGPTRCRNWPAYCRSKLARRGSEALVRRSGLSAPALIQGGGSSRLADLEWLTKMKQELAVHLLVGLPKGDALMSKFRWLLLSFCVVMLAAILGSSALAADKDTAKQEGKVAGIMIDKKDDWITVKADGEDEPVKYLIGKDSNKELTKAMKSIFNASRVQLTYKKDGDSRQLVSIKKQILKASGTVTGTVVKVYNDFWVEVKPKNGLADAYAPGANYNDKAFMENLKGLKPGDSVTIKFTTDGERHRIQSLQKN
jgi:hypothetical protein